jgi:hypothetical protein
VSPASSPARRWSILGLLLGVLVAGLAVSGVIVFGNGAGPGLGHRVSSVFDPPKDESVDREKALAAARTFVQRFHTYGPELLDGSGRMPEYAAVGDLMSAKFAKVFDQNEALAEQTVKETGVDRVATVYGVGISAIDADSASLLVGGIVTTSYPGPKQGDKPIELAPQRFRYQVDLVKIGGVWKVDDLDDVDDGLPSLGEAPTQPQGGAPSGVPSGAPTSTPSGQGAGQ